VNVIAILPDLGIGLDAFKKRGGVLDFAFFDLPPSDCSAETHREAARQFLEQRATETRAFISSIDGENPLAQLFTYKWNEAKLCGDQIAFDEFWGSDDVDQKEILPGTWSVPEIDGYKAAFFHPPHGLDGGVSGNMPLFESINRQILGESRDHQGVNVWSWSTDCSSYFDDGHEWWGAFLWTISRCDSTMLTVIGASATD